MSTTASLKMPKRAAQAVSEESDWKNLYTIAGIAALLALAANLLDIVVGMGETELVASGSQSALDWFAFYQENWLKGLYMLGILNLVYGTCLIPVYMGLYAAHRRTHGLYAALALSVYFIGMAVYMANNAAIPMLVLSGKYAAAAGDAQRALLAAAGEAVLASGEDFTPGAFPGMFFEIIAAVAMALVMLRGSVFAKRTAWIGLIGFTLLTLFTIWATFVPVLYAVAFYGFGMVGGLFVLAWFVLVARRFFQLGRPGTLNAVQTA
jgi:hypothetical protein